MSHTPIKKILCSVDFSEFSQATAAEAFILAACHGAELLLLNVVNEKNYEELERLGGRVQALNGLAENAINAMEEDRAEKMRSLLAELKEHHIPFEKVPHSSRIALGVPYERILEISQEESADLIVMGAKGRSSLARALRFGSTAEKIFRRASCKVMFVR
jgi:universal stress protein A